MTDKQFSRRSQIEIRHEENEDLVDSFHSTVTCSRRSGEFLSRRQHTLGCVVGRFWERLCRWWEAECTTVFEKGCIGNVLFPNCRYLGRIEHELCSTCNFCYHILRRGRKDFDCTWSERSCQLHAYFIQHSQMHQTTLCVISLCVCQVHWQVYGNCHSSKLQIHKLQEYCQK